MKRAVAVRHVAFEDLGAIAEVLDQRGYETYYLEAGVDDLATVQPGPDDLLIVLGGPIGAYEEARYPFLREELGLIERCLRRESRVLGICLGAQMLARALGARVYPAARKEIGIGPLDLTPEGSRSCLVHLAPDRRVLHWHGDTFDLPSGTTRLASTALTPNQAFARGSSALGLQFHVEVDPARFERWLIGHTYELSAAGIDVDGLRRDARAHAAAIVQSGRRVIAAWLEEGRAT
jgi:GMP synthase (glutamine-hydrolysing)